jgi:hypothetical protein
LERTIGKSSARKIEEYEGQDRVPRDRLWCRSQGKKVPDTISPLGELGVLAPDLEARQWVAYAGLDPRHYTSGTSVHKKPRISKAGNKHMRHALFMPALVAVQHDPHLRAFYQHLLAKGKFKMQALVAVMRKLLHALHAMFKNHQPYDGSKLFRIPSIPTQEVLRAPVSA